MKHFQNNITISFSVLVLVSLMAFSGCAPSSDQAAELSKKPEVKAVPGQEQKVDSPAPVPSTLPITEERTYFDFETADLGGWEVPTWAGGKSDYVAKSVAQSEEFASHGKSSMKIETDFPGGSWTAGLVEIQQYLDLSRYRVISIDIYLPEDAPLGLKAKLIITVGDNWKFVEMSRSVSLMPGEWETLTANIEPGSYDWKRVVPDEKFAEDVRKIAIRIESNNKPAYTGSIYVDNVRVGR